jgi:hypothetical protein
MPTKATTHLFAPGTSASGLTAKQAVVAGAVAVLCAAGIARLPSRALHAGVVEHACKMWQRQQQ